jgi:hypothetical protein
MNNYDEQLTEIAIEAIRHIDDKNYFAIIVMACQARLAESSGNITNEFGSDKVRKELLEAMEEKIKISKQKES